VYEVVEVSAVPEGPGWDSLFFKRQMMVTCKYHGSVKESPLQHDPKSMPVVDRVPDSSVQESTRVMSRRVGDLTIHPLTTRDHVVVEFL
jgi:hypothetical protein